MNLTDSAIDGWIKWKVTLKYFTRISFNILLCSARLNCSLHFQVVQDGGDDGNRTSDGHKMGQGLGEENGEQLDEARRRDEVVGKYNAETTSPDSYVDAFLSLARSLTMLCKVGRKETTMLRYNISVVLACYCWLSAARPSTESCLLNWRSNSFAPCVTK